MRTLIVPCAGSKNIDKIPIFLNRHPDGELLAIKSIIDIYPETYDRIIYVITDQIEKKYNVSSILKNENKGRYPIEISILEQDTLGPAMTVYQTIKNAKVSGEFAIRDSHAFLKLKENYYGNFIAGLDLTKYKRTIDNLKNKSFLILNEQKNALDIIEKHFCSDVVSVGLYGFKKTEDFLMAYEHLDDSDYPIEKKYVSHIISYLIGYKQRVFHAVDVSEYEDWSTEYSWSKIQKSHANCFLNLDEIFEDGSHLSDEIIFDLQKLSKSGVAFIGFTYKKCESEWSQYLRDNGINVINTICGCNYSRCNITACNAEVIRNMVLDL